MIDPLPHQRIAVYEHMLTQPRLRFLLGDEPGAGKTIMAGLYIREMLARRLLATHPDRPSGRAGRQLGAGAAHAVRPRLPDRLRGRFPRRQSLLRHERRPGHRQRRYPGERSHVRPAPGARRRPVRPGHLRRGAQARRRPPGRFHDPPDRPLPGRRGDRRHPVRRPPMVARLGLQPPAAADRHAPHGQGLPVLLPLAAAGARRPGHGRRLQRLSGRRPPTPLPPPDQGGDGQLRGEADLPRPRQRHAELRPVAGRYQRAGPLRPDDRLHRALLQPRPHLEPVGGPAGHVGLPAPARQLDVRASSGRSSDGSRSSTA